MNRLATAKTTFGSRRRLAIGVATLCLLCTGSLSTAGGAFASSGAVARLTATCEEEKLPSGYSEQEYHEALEHLSAYAVEYTRCDELIVDAERRGARGPSTGGHGGSGGGTSGGSTTKGGASGGSGASVAPATPEEQQEIAKAQQTPPAAVTLGGGSAGPGAAVAPGVIHTNVSSAFKSLPDALIAVIAAIAALIVVLLGRAVRERMRFADEEA